MDAALAAAYRAARAAPGSSEAREDYARALERAGRAALACYERGAAASLAGRGPAPGEVPTPAPGALAWIPQDDAPPLPPETGPAWTPGLVVGGLDGVARPWVLVPWPVCAACVDGAPTCAICHGRGEVLDFAGYREDRVPCETCEGTGREACPACRGSRLDPGQDRALDDPDADPPPCAHADLELEWQSGEGPALFRCRACRRALLRRFPGDPRHPACRACGRFGCDCGRPGRTGIATQ